MVNFPTNLQATGSSTTWASLPEFPMKTTFEVTAGEAVLLLADISYVRHETANVNTFFQIIVDDTLVVGYSNTGNANGMQYRSLSFSGVATALSIGSHTAELQVRISPLMATMTSNINHMWAAAAVRYTPVHIYAPNLTLPSGAVCVYARSTRQKVATSACHMGGRTLMAMAMCGSPHCVPTIPI